ncbi:hypothetical protein TraAM80_06796 [Trypanosoma rangeli]|uniref:Transmembrane protein n=1 Tax=Trypanosoma rangeli TaxID=5698 RepID=A0A3R7KUT2_TRYRA|nr:uncharacterized protein TraAM80_06796 [Trypanosoma rangeli]RNF01799.1 hypothetical protein TraAM80_06796 [Trypanosoma rangeli]|eukprot:RNF01799.1 hypothetical protein TraAM80_06796 [Trypanosoma rangeli]
MSWARKAGNVWDVTLSEWQLSWQELRSSKLTGSLLFAIICVLTVIVGNVVLLIAVNFWLSIFPVNEDTPDASQITVQVIVCCLLAICFSVFGAVFIVVYGVRPLWRALVDTDRVRGPLYRLLLLFFSGAANAMTGVLFIHAMPYIPEFVQAVLLSAIPFCTQLWTYLLIPPERKRRYFSLTFIGSFILFVAGVLLSSMSSFLDTSKTGRAAPWDWSLIYLASAVVFGLWCVLQRLYLDAMMFRSAVNGSVRQETTPSLGGANIERVPTEPSDACRGTTAVGIGSQADTNAMFPPSAAPATPHQDNIQDEAGDLVCDALLVAHREWGKQDENDLAAKTVLLLVGMAFQTVVSLACVPMDVIPWFGKASNASEAWAGFVASCNFIFSGWYNIRYGLLHTLGMLMSFVGCAYLNERSPTLASVVLQLSGPLTGLVLVIAPKWDVYGEHGVLWHKIGGVIMLIVAGLMYHVWDQASLRELVNKHQV